MIKSDTDYIRECFKLAKKAKGETSPNPMVGAVIVKDNEVLAKGFHRRSGLPHAELDAILNAKDQGIDITGATLYCNLEPCCHTNKKTPPCAQRIIEEKIAKVVISNTDPNPNVAGLGCKLLEENGIEVITGILAEEGALLNEVFFTHIIKQRPFVHLKWAQTLDGKIASIAGDSKWITGEKARAYCHKERSLYDAILVGSQTAIQDNPKLTIRLKGKKEYAKKRIVLGCSALPQQHHLIADEFKDQTILYQNIESLGDLLKNLYRRGIKSIYVEGGGQTLNRFIQEGIFDRVSIYSAPKLIGKGISTTETLNITKMQDSLLFQTPSWKIIGDDALMESTRNVCLQD